MIIAIEEISRGDASLGVSLLDSVTLPMNLLYTFGTEGQKQKWLVPLASGGKDRRLWIDGGSGWFQTRVPFRQEVSRRGMSG